MKVILTTNLTSMKTLCTLLVEHGWKSCVSDTPSIKAFEKGMRAYVKKSVNGLVVECYPNDSSDTKCKFVDFTTLVEHLDSLAIDHNKYMEAHELDTHSIVNKHGNLLFGDSNITFQTSYFKNKDDCNGALKEINAILEKYGYDEDNSY